MQLTVSEFVSNEDVNTGLSVPACVLLIRHLKWGFEMLEIIEVKVAGVPEQIVSLDVEICTAWPKSITGDNTKNIHISLFINILNIILSKQN